MTRVRIETATASLLCTALVYANLGGCPPSSPPDPVPTIPDLLCAIFGGCPFQQLYDTLAAQIEAAAGQPGQQGEPGPMGPQGEMGATGPPWRHRPDRSNRDHWGHRRNRSYRRSRRNRGYRRGRTDRRIRPCRTGSNGRSHLGPPRCGWHVDRCVRCRNRECRSNRAGDL